jgi:hypothetical protein
LAGSVDLFDQPYAAAAGVDLRRGTASGHAGLEPAWPHRAVDLAG